MRKEVKCKENLS